MAVLKDFLNGFYQLKLKQLLDYYFGAILFPSTAITCMGFWFFISIDESFIVYDELQIIDSIFIYDLTHTVPMIFVFAEMLLVSIRYPTGRSSVIAINVTILSYWIWLIIAKNYNHCWAYPIFNSLSNVNIFFCIIASVIIINLFQRIGGKINAFLHRNLRR